MRLFIFLLLLISQNLWATSADDILPPTRCTVANSLSIAPDTIVINPLSADRAEVIFKISEKEIGRDVCEVALNDLNQSQVKVSCVQTNSEAKPGVILEARIELTLTGKDSYISMKADGLDGNVFMALEKMECGGN